MNSAETYIMVGKEKGKKERKGNAKIMRGETIQWGGKTGGERNEKGR